MTGQLILIPNVLSENTQDQYLPPVLKRMVPEIKYYLVEEVRTARRFISSLKTGVEIEGLIFQVLNKDTPFPEVSAWMKGVPANESIGVLSEAGCPGIADPGALAVRAAHQLGRKVVPLPGPSAIVMAVMASGLNGQSFAFNGYLPIDKGQRKQVLQMLEKESAQKKRAQVFMETPFRNQALIEDLFGLLHSSTLLTIAADITGEQELIMTLSISEWKKKGIPELHKIPAVFVIQAS